MRTRQGTDVTLLVVAIAVMASGYLVFRAFFLSAKAGPFAQEILLVFVGTLVTISITAFLLNRQTELELRKEGNVLLFERKTEVYLAVIEKVAELVARREFDEDLVEDLRILNHKLAVVGSAPVIESFDEVLQRILSGLRSGALSDDEAEQVMHAVSGVSIAMRSDLLPRVGPEEERKIAESILRNSRRVEDIDDLHEGGASGEDAACR
ncbi:MAG: hypothetical protein D6731_01890 [Planctomycetota bacterium]|nr:MAG: hypothetical protein D6731_01890 [Planctomycetota bacterium]